MLYSSGLLLPEKGRGLKKLVSELRRLLSTSKCVVLAAGRCLSLLVPASWSSRWGCGKSSLKLLHQAQLCVQPKAARLLVRG